MIVHGGALRGVRGGDMLLFLPPISCIWLSDMPHCDATDILGRPEKGEFLQA